MQKLKPQDEIQALQNALLYYNFDSKYIIHPTADGRTAQKYAIAEKRERGAVQIHTNFMTYDEMNAYFYGYSAARQNKFNTKTT